LLAKEFGVSRETVYSYLRAETGDPALPAHEYDPKAS
jgi:hypothetical protein